MLTVQQAKFPAFFISDYLIPAFVLFIIPFFR